jgi:hypothetical protein
VLNVNHRAVGRHQTERQQVAPLALTGRVPGEHNTERHLIGIGPELLLDVSAARKLPGQVFYHLNFVTHQDVGERLHEVCFQVCLHESLFIIANAHVISVTA